MLAKLLPSTWSRIPAWLRTFSPSRFTVPSFRGVETTCSTAEAHNSRYLLNVPLEAKDPGPEFTLVPAATWIQTEPHADVYPRPGQRLLGSPR